MSEVTSWFALAKSNRYTSGWKTCTERISIKQTGEEAVYSSWICTGCCESLFIAICYFLFVLCALSLCFSVCCLTQTLNHHFVHSTKKMQSHAQNQGSKQKLDRSANFLNRFWDHRARVAAKEINDYFPLSNLRYMRFFFVLHFFVFFFPLKHTHTKYTAFLRNRNVDWMPAKNKTSINRMEKFRAYADYRRSPSLCYWIYDAKSMNKHYCALREYDFFYILCLCFVCYALYYVFCM